MERMTVRELSQLRYLKREIEVERRRLAALRARVGPPQTRLSGTPRAPNATDAVGGLAVEIAYLEKLIEQNMRRAIAELLRLQSFINEIPDSDTRQIFYLRYVKGRSWVAVAFALGMGDEATVRKRHAAYLKEGRSRTRNVRTQKISQTEPNPVEPRLCDAPAQSAPELSWRPAAD